MTSGIKQLPSGFWSVWIDGQWVSASAKTKEEAEAILASFTQPSA